MIGESIVLGKRGGGTASRGYRSWVEGKGRHGDKMLFRSLVPNKNIYGTELAINESMFHLLNLKWY